MSGLPPGATATFSPSTIAQNGGAQTVTLTIQTAAAIGSLHSPQFPWTRSLGATLALLLLPFTMTRSRRSKFSSRMLLCLLFLGSFGAVAGLTGCGTHNGFLEQPSTNYPLNITAASGAAQHTVTVVLNVQ